MRLFKTTLLLCSLAASSMLPAKTFKVALDADPVSLDPHEQLSEGTLQMSHWMFDPLVRYRKDMSFEPRLASSWKRIDAKTFQITLKNGVKFHSGNAFTADDVVWTMNRLKSSPDFKAIFASVTKIKKVDKLTVHLITEQPYPLIENILTYVFPMDSKFYQGKDKKGQPKDLIKKNVGTFASTNASGTGPFTLVSREQGVKLELARFEQYWDKKSPGNVSKLVLTPIKEETTRVAALLSGDVDFIAPVSPNYLQRIEQDKNTRLLQMPGTRIITFMMNQKSQPAFKNLKVRQAVIYAINNEGIAKKLMRGFATPAGQLSPKGYLGYNTELKPRYDLNKAKQLMKEAGFEKGFKVTMISPNNRYVNDEKIAQAVASMLAKINIQVDLKTYPKAQYWPLFDERAGDMLMIGWHSDTEDSANLFEFLTMCPDQEAGWGQYNAGYYCNPGIDKMVLSTQEEVNEQKRAQTLQSIEAKLHEDAAIVPLHWQNPTWGARQNVDAEPVVNMMNFPYFGDLVIK